MFDQTVGIFKNLNITAKTSIDKKVKDIERIVTKTLLKKYHAIFLVYKETLQIYARE